MARRFMAAALTSVGETADADLRDALARLAAWDGDMAEDSVAATLHFGWLVHFTRAAIAQAVGPERAATLLARGEQTGFPFMPFYEIAYELALRWLEGAAGLAGCEPPPEWVGDARPLLRPALRRTLDVLIDHFGPDPAEWRWGRLHRVSFQHEMTRLPGIGRLWKPLTIPAPGDGYTINQSDLSPHFPPDPATIIASCRLIIDVGAWDDALAALPGGQSGHPASPHYRDRLAEWREGRYFPLLFARPRVLAAAAGTWRLEPGGE